MNASPGERKQATRDRILDAAEALIKARGSDATTVEAVMRRAGLTVGGFYAHFPSKAALTREALMRGIERSIRERTAGLDDLAPGAFAKAFIDRYLAEARLSDLESACPLTLLLPEAARAEPALREELAARTGTMLATFEQRLPPVSGISSREVALAVLATLAGAVSFAHAAATPRGRQRIASAAAASLHRWLGLV
jgi:TetR/AcrR family transcriptional repressor of nem operon